MGAYDSFKTAVQPFKWLNYWILYLPMFAKKTPSHKKRWFISSVFCTVITASITVFTCGYWSFISYSDYTFNLFCVLWIVAFITLSTSRIITLYYFATQFNYPWNSIKQRTARTKSINRRIQIEIISIIFSFLILLFSDIYPKLDIIYLTSDLLYLYFIHLPIFICQFVLTIILYKVETKLKEFIIKIDNGESILVDCDIILSEYVECRYNFTKKYKILELFVMMRLISSIAFQVGGIGTGKFKFDSEEDIFKILHFLIWSYLDTLPFVEFMLSGLYVTDSFNILHEKLWQFGTSKKCKNSMAS
eukprot:88530_1